MRRGLADLSREQLAVLVPELLLCGHLIDRAGMPHLLGAFGLEGMTAGPGTSSRWGRSTSR